MYTLLLNLGRKSLIDIVYKDVDNKLILYHCSSGHAKYYKSGNDPKFAKEYTYFMDKQVQGKYYIQEDGKWVTKEQ